MNNIQQIEVLEAAMLPNNDSVIFRYVTFNISTLYSLATASLSDFLVSSFASLA